jgi:hypothetical protein
VKGSVSYREHGVATLDKHHPNAREWDWDLCRRDRDAYHRRCDVTEPIDHVQCRGVAGYWSSMDSKLVTARSHRPIDDATTATLVLLPVPKMAANSFRRAVCDSTKRVISKWAKRSVVRDWTMPEHLAEKIEGVPARHGDGGETTLITRRPCYRRGC